MIFFLTTHPLWLSGAILVGLTTVLASFGPWLVRRYVSLEQLTENNEIAGFKFATVGVLYAVLIAFAIILVWEKYSDAEASVVQEAGAAATIYRLSYGIDDKAGTSLRQTLNEYLTVTIRDDWPAMDRGALEAPRSGRLALNAVYAALQNAKDSGGHADAFIREILRQLDGMTQARRARLTASQGAVPRVLWLVLFGGAVLTVIFTFFFGTRNLRAQTIMTALLSILIFSELFIIVAIDRPFSGTVKVEPTALANVLADFKLGLDSGSQPASEQR